MEETAAQPPQETSIEQPASIPSSSKRKKLIVLAIVLVVIILLIGAFFYFSKKTTPTTTTTIPLPTKAPVTQQSPQIVFASYTSPRVVDALPQSVEVRALKNNYTKQEVENFAAYFGLSNATKDGNMYSFTNTSTPASRGVLLFDSTTGMFVYTSYGKKLTYSGTSSQKAISALTAMGIYDPTISCDITYKKSNMPSLTYVECHRDWGKLGTPLVSLPGVLNYPENTLVTSLKPGYVPPSSPNNPVITNVSTGQNGKVRPNDFNTVTIALTEDGTLLSVNSTMRVLDTNTPNKSVPAADFKTKDEVLAEITGKPAEFAFAVPAGNGTTDWDKVFPGNKGQASNASVEELSLVYLEKLPGTAQSEYTPYYLVKGTATLTSGYSVKYTQAVPAIKGSTFKIAEADTIQLDTFTPTVNPPTPTTIARTNPVTPIVPTPTISTDNPDQDCRYGTDFSSQGLANFTLNIPGYGSIIISRQPGSPHTLFAAQINASNASLTAARVAILKLIEDQFIINYQANGQYKLKQYGGLQGLYVAVPFDWGAGATYNGSVPSPKSKGDPPEKDQLRSSFEKRALAIDDGKIETVPDPGFYGPKGLLGSQAGAVETEYLFVTDPGNQSGHAYSCYLTGGSPTVFFYPTSETNALVKTGATITYSNPGVNSSNSWNISLLPNGTVTTSNGSVYDRIYYEFKKKSVIVASQKGFITTRDNLMNLASFIAEKLALNKKEAQALGSEFANAAADLRNSQFVKVLLVDPQEIRTNLPLSITPRPDRFYRVHFVLSNTDVKTTITPPDLIPLTRAGFTVIELGAYSF